MNELPINPCVECPENFVCDSEYTDFERYSNCPRNTRNRRVKDILDNKTKAFTERPKKSWRDERHDDVISRPELLKSYEQEYGTISNYLKDFDVDDLLYVEKVHLFLTDYATRIEITFSGTIDILELAKTETKYLIEPTSAGRIKIVHYNKWLIDRY